ncbi:Acg family FMN-binding oxidoreductase [Saccharopolyspora cebuensis]|uniref:Nitroreductase n=1 Tax=Saccharopolyspora cebuensis TaxID=418759 RepID=A0ABV4CE53_9PSEU
MTAFRPALGLTAEQVREVVELAGRAPSLHNVQPWRFALCPEVLELHADPTTRLPHTDPGDAELRLGCGAALFTLRVALAHHGVDAAVVLPPRPAADSTLLARVAATSRPDGVDGLFRSIEARRTNRRPFRADAVPTSAQHALAGAVEAEGAVLHVVDRAERARLIELVHRAHAAQSADPGFRAELARWTGRSGEERRGVPVESAGPEPEPQDEWVLRDFAAGASRPRVPGKDFEDDPLIVVVAVGGVDWQADVRAGQAVQRMLLTATGLGLSASFLSQVVEVPETRDALCGLLGGTLRPKAVLRLGFGSPVPATPRRDPAELLVEPSP